MRFVGYNGRQGAFDLSDPDRLIFRYQRAFALLVQALTPVDRFLALGVGTGTSLRTVKSFSPNVELYGVGIDSRVIDLAIEYFDCPDFSAVNYTISDGVQFLHNATSLFDLIFVDAYSEDALDASCLDDSFPALLSRSLTPDGLVAFNIATTYPLSRQVKSFLTQAKTVFPITVVHPLTRFPFVKQNVLVVLANSPVFLHRWATLLSGVDFVSRSTLAFWLRQLKGFSR